MKVLLFLSLIAPSLATNVAPLGQRGGHHIENVLEELRSSSGTGSSEDIDTSHTFDAQLLDHYTTSVLDPSADRTWSQRFCEFRPRPPNPLPLLPGDITDDPSPPNPPSPLLS